MKQTIQTPSLLAGILGAICGSTFAQPAAPTASATSPVAPNHQRPWQPADSVRTRYFTYDFAEPRTWFFPDPSIAEWVANPKRSEAGVSFSPDGKYFFTISYRGDVQKDIDLFYLHVFDATKVASYLENGPDERSKPDVFREILVQTSPSDHASYKGTSIMTDARWEHDSSGVLYRAITRDGHYQGYRFDINSGVLEQVTHTSTGVSWFTARAGHAIYKGPVGSDGTVPMNYPITPIVYDPKLRNAVVSRAFQGVLAGLHNNTYGLSGWESGKESPLAPFDDATLSPDGRWLATFSRGQFTVLDLEDASAPRSILKVSVDTTVNLRTGDRMLWSANSRQVVLIGARGIPEFTGDGAYVASYRVDNGHWQMLEPLGNPRVLAGVEWNESSGRLVLIRIGPKKTETRTGYELNGDRWASVSQEDLARTIRERLQVEIQQDENNPPQLVAKMKGREVTLVGTDPVQRGVMRTQVRRFIWHDYDGKQREAGLLLPAGFRAGTPVPVVIQPYYYIPQLFLPDGPNRTAESAQALAARGLAVVVLDTSDLMATPFVRKETEGPLLVRRIDAIVDALVEQGITDATRIGIVGFSRGGYQAYYSATHPERTALCATVQGDSVTWSYPQLLLTAAQGSTSSGLLSSAGTFWKAPAEWLELETSFNIDRLRTPALFTENTPDVGSDNSVYSLQTIGAFMLNHKPFDYYYFQGGTHELRFPLQRMAMMNLVVDWCAFWMLDEEDPAPSKAANYVRWQKIRANWDIERAKERSRGEAGFIVTRSGLEYKIRTRKVGNTTAPDSILTLRYSGIQADGSSFATNQIMHVLLKAAPSPEPGWVGNRFFDDVRPSNASDVYFLDGQSKPLVALGHGWHEVLPLLHPGETATLYMPAAIAKGLPDLPTSTDLLHFEIELISVETARPSQLSYTEPPGDPAQQRVRQQMRERGIADVRHDFWKLNKLGYEALYELNDIPKALQYFQWNIVLFPSQPDLYDSLAEGYLQAGDRDQAIAHYTKALEISPNIKSDPNARATLERLKADPKNLPILQKELRDAYEASHAK